MMGSKKAQDCPPGEPEIHQEQPDHAHQQQDKPLDHCGRGRWSRTVAYRITRNQMCVAAGVASAWVRNAIEDCRSARFMMRCPLPAGPGTGPLPRQPCPGTLGSHVGSDERLSWLPGAEPGGCPEDNHVSPIQVADIGRGHVSGVLQVLTPIGVGVDRLLASQFGNLTQSHVRTGLLSTLGRGPRKGVHRAGGAVVTHYARDPRLGGSAARPCTRCWARWRSRWDAARVPWEQRGCSSSSTLGVGGATLRLGG
jgi:hypothetical protein